MVFKLFYLCSVTRTNIVSIQTCAIIKFIISLIFANTQSYDKKFMLFHWYFWLCHHEDKAVVRVIRLASFLCLWFVCLPSDASRNTYHLTWVSLTLDVGYLFTGCSSKAQLLLKSWKVMLWKCCIQYASQFGKLSSGHRTGKGQFSFQSQRKAMPKNAQTTAQLHSSCALVK